MEATLLSTRKLAPVLPENMSLKRLAAELAAPILAQQHRLGQLGESAVKHAGFAAVAQMQVRSLGLAANATFAHKLPSLTRFGLPPELLRQQRLLDLGVLDSVAAEHLKYVGREQQRVADQVGLRSDFFALPTARDADDGRTEFGALPVPHFEPRRGSVVTVTRPVQAFGWTVDRLIQIDRRIGGYAYELSRLIADPGADDLQTAYGANSKMVVVAVADFAKRQLSISPHDHPEGGYIRYAITRLATERRELLGRHGYTVENAVSLLTWFNKTGNTSEHSSRSQVAELKGRAPSVINLVWLLVTGGEVDEYT